MSNPFSAASLAGLRPSEAAAAAAAAAAAHHHGLSWPPGLGWPFFHPSLDPRLPFGTGAFRPLTPGEEHSLKSPFHPGVFPSAPPAGLTPPHHMHNHHQQQQQQQHVSLASGKLGTSTGGGGGGSNKITVVDNGNNLPFNLSRYNPLFSSAVSMAETSMATGRLLFSAANGQRSGVIQGQPESPSSSNSGGSSGGGGNANHLSSGGVTLSPTMGPMDCSGHAGGSSLNSASHDGRDTAGTPLSDAATERSTPDDIRTSRRKFFFFSILL